ncbi:MAG: hypothetical protein IJH83_05470 [Coriobacteriales bacterium]|nr:hypothetical protein [Coriobacteriales bacterium]
MKDIPNIPFPLDDLVIVTGHYGTGKTNFSINLAMDAAAAGMQVTVIDLDIVNPYFRSSDYVDLLQGAGIEVVGPNFARTTLDTPSLSGRVYAVLQDLALRAADAGDKRLVIIDVGGDDAGATALGRFAWHIEQCRSYQMLYVVNAYRNMTQTAEEAVSLLGEIEAASHLHASAVINNSHLQGETTWETIEAGMPFAQRAAAELGLPLLATTVPDSLPCGPDGVPLYCVRRYVLTPWED